MDALFSILQIICLVALACGAWMCLLHAGRYDADRLRADRAAPRIARLRGHAPPEPSDLPPLDMAA